VVYDVSRIRVDVSRILVVDDEPGLVGFLTRALTAEGYAVESASDGATALAMIRSNPYELIVLDLRIPVLNGFDVLRAAMKVAPDQRVFVLSAVGDPDTRVRCLELGAVDFLSKPFALAELVARIRARLLEPSGATTANQWILEAGRLSLNLLRRTLRFPGGTASLTDREFLVVQHLMRKSGVVCSRAELLESVWGYSFDPGSNVVDVCVGRIRSKIAPGLIETVRDGGYRVVP
jgi:DNA-binding response OmpR family regulator